MKKTLSFLMLVAVVAMSFVVKPSRYEVSVADSKLEWLGKKVTGQHNGLISLKKGELTIKDGKLTGGSFTIDMNSITCLDLKEAEWNGKLVGHLKSDDFFGTATYPTADLKIKKVSDKGNGTFAVTADLTIKGITNQVTFDANVTEKSGKATATASIVVNRAKYNVKYGSGSFFDGLGDKMIYDDFTLTVSLTANAK